MSENQAEYAQQTKEVENLSNCGPRKRKSSEEASLGGLDTRKNRRFFNSKRCVFTKDALQELDVQFERTRHDNRAASYTSKCLHAEQTFRISAISRVVPRGARDS